MKLLLQGWNLGYSFMSQKNNREQNIGYCVCQLLLGWETVAGTYLYLGLVKHKVHLFCFAEYLRNIEDLADMKENVICCIRGHKRISNYFIVKLDLVSVIFNAEVFWGLLFSLLWEVAISVLLSVTLQQWDFLGAFLVFPGDFIFSLNCLTSY